MKQFVIVLLLILLFSVSIVCHGGEDIRIGDIVCKGLTRTDKSLILRYLPIKIGDKWSNDLETMLEKMLFEANVFSPFSLDVSTEVMEENQVRVVIMAEDPNIFMYHPVIFGISKTADLLSSQLNQRLINPFGNGLSFLFGVNWKRSGFENDNSGPWKSFGINSLMNKGKIICYKYKDFEEHKNFNQRKYDLSGYSHLVSMRQIISSDIVLEYAVTYQDSSYLEGNTCLKQEYIVFSIKTELFEHFNAFLGYGKSLKNNEENFNYLNFNFKKKYKVQKNDLIIFSLKGGLANSKRPFSFQFQGGGYSDIPIRGHDYNLAGNVYLVNNIEYQKQLLKNGLKGIIFMDTGKMVDSRVEFSKEDFMWDAGIGIGYNTPLGLLRIDRGFNLLDDGDTWNFSLGYDF